MIETLKRRLEEFRTADISAAPPFRRFAVRTVRVLLAVLRDLAAGQLTLRAMSMVYTTLLSLVPLLAVTFSVLKGFGVHQSRLAPALHQFLEPLGDRGPEIADRVIAFVDNINAGALGAAGLGFLLYTTFSLLSKIEGSFNWVWRVRTPRSIGQRLSEYLSVLLVGPLTIFIALGITASITNHEAATEIEQLSGGVIALGRMVPYLMVIGVFTFMYAFMPNVKVRLGAALAGAVAAGVLWQTIGSLFALFVASSTQTTVIYSSFAILIFFLIWMHLAWLILLIGASISFYVQNPRYTRPTGRLTDLANRGREEAALAVMVLVARQHQRGEHSWNPDELSRHLVVPPDSLTFVFDRLLENHLLVETEDGGLVPGRAATEISLRDLMEAVRRPRVASGTVLAEESLTEVQPVPELVASIESALGQALGERTLSDLL